ncbi:ABC transporter substrate-binding protein [Kribbella sp. GL6]|uniref:ABC transporter substrate-binding protein n=1 Tax=Kribbella sp. GL6 TaxID=3419765 RepID=UPI003D01DB43
MNTKWFTAGLLLAVAVSGCTAGRAASGGAAQDVLVWGHKGQVPTLDPARSDYSQTNDVDRLLYDTLLDYGTDGKLTGRLATAFAYSADVRSITVKLRDDVKFHDGTPLTAKDVAYTLDRNRKIGQGIDTMTKSYASTTVTGDHDLVIKLNKPDTLVLGALSRVYVVNSALVQKNAGTDLGQSWLASNDAGSGPYTLGSSAGGRVELHRYDAYFAPRAGRPKTFVQLQVDEPGARRDGIVAGRINAADIDVHDMKAVTDGGGQIYRSTGNGLMSVYFNTRYGAAANPAVREAISYAFDYRGALDKIELGNGTLANGPLPPNLDCRPTLPTVQQDQAKARKILADAGLHDVKLTLRFQPSFSDQAQVATLLQSNLAAIGIKLALEPITFPAYLTMLSDFKTVPEMMLATESPAYPDPGVMLLQSYSSKAIGTNKTAYENPTVDALLTRAAAAPEAGERCDLYRQAQTLIAADHAVMPMMLLLGAIGYTADVGGIDPHAVTGGFDLYRLEIQKK